MKSKWSMVLSNSRFFFEMAKYCGSWPKQVKKLQNSKAERRSEKLDGIENFTTFFCKNCVSSNKSLPFPIKFYNFSTLFRNYHQISCKCCSFLVLTKKIQVARGFKAPMRMTLLHLCACKPINPRSLDHLHG